MAKNTIHICNYTFTISSDDDQQYMDNIAAKVERRVKRIADDMPSRNMTEVALFVAMDYCDQCMKANGDGSNLRGQIKDYLQESGYARKQLDEAKKENEALKAELAALRKRLSANDAPASAVPTISETPKAKPETKTKAKEKPAVQVKSEPKKSDAPIQGLFSDDAFAESADATAEIMSFFEQKAFEDDED